MTDCTDPWDEVWDAYEARRAATAVAASGRQPLPLPQPETTVQEQRRGWLKPLAVAGVVFCLGCTAGSAWPVLNLYGLVLRQDMPGLLRQLDLGPVQDGLRQGLRAHAGLHGPTEANGAERLLAGMAEDMVAALARPGILEQVLLARRDGAPLLRLAEWGGTAVELAQPDGPGGFRFDLVWTGQGWQAAGARLLEAPPAAAPPGPRLALAQARSPG